MEAKKVDKLTVIDIFCGAGGFSEGFRQQDFEIVQGIDHWEPAIKTFNHNFGLDCSVRDVLDFEKSIEAIEALPDTDIILGSPPCVTFSSSNISGKADKTLGVTLTQVFLRIVAVKKWKENSKLKAWFMENVPSSMKHLAVEYTFEELGLGAWAIKNKIGKNKVAIKLDGNQLIINSADYGSAQARERVISGEIIKRKKLIVPNATHNEEGTDGLYKWRSLRSVKGYLPRINCKKSSRKVIDPNYPGISVTLSKLTDHFYDTGLYECEWRQSKFLKVNHPYMGRMSFPENEQKPSRTITATKIGTSREAIIYRSEFNRKGDGEYRTPTVRESACLMGFPITYQFIGSKGVKCRLVGNAVCPTVSSAFAKQVRKELGLHVIRIPRISSECDLPKGNDVNDFVANTFSTPPKRKKGSRFRRHPFKHGNITVTLSNYDIDKNTKNVDKWITSVQYGNGDGFPTFNYTDGFYRTIEPLIRKIKKGPEFLGIINNGFSEKIGSKTCLQEMYENQTSKDRLLEPTLLIEEVEKVVQRLRIGRKDHEQQEIVLFKEKEKVPVTQIFALYAVNKICSIANQEI